MLEQLNKHFDHYSIQARFMPAFFIFLPLVLTTIAWCPKSTTVLGGAMTFLISFGVMSFLSTVISNMGNAIQKAYFERWGGAPTTTLLMPESDELDRYTKQRYFKWLNSKIPDLNFVLDSDDKSDLQQKIRSATNFLREYTRDTKKYSAVYRDNVAYGFSRNLVAIRYIGIAVSIISLMINVSAMLSSAGLWLHSETSSAGGFGPIGIVAIVVSVISMALLVFVTNERFVKQRAFRYARSLYEVCEMG